MLNGAHTDVIDKAHNIQVHSHRDSSSGINFKSFGYVVRADGDFQLLLLSPWCNIKISHTPVNGKYKASEKETLKMLHTSDKKKYNIQPLVYCYSIV